MNIHSDLKVMQTNFTPSMWIFRTWTYAVLALCTSEKNISFYIFVLSNTKPVTHTFAIIFYTIIYVALVMWNIFHKTSGYIFSMTCYHVYQNLRWFHFKSSVTKYVHRTSAALCMIGGQPHIFQKIYLIFRWYSALRKYYKWISTVQVNKFHKCTKNMWTPWQSNWSLVAAMTTVIVWTVCWHKPRL
jgi:hypothetical protein